MTTTSRRKPSGLNRQALRTWAMIFLAAGIAGKCIIQNTLLGLSNLSGEQLLQMMDANPSVVSMVTLALVLQAVEACAVPVFVFLLVEGFQKTSDLKLYALRVVGVALLAEIPYNLALGGKFLVMESRNPVVAMVICMAMMYFYQRYAGAKVTNVLIKAVVTVAALLWTVILGIEHGFLIVLLAATLWFTWDKQNWRTLGGVTVTMCGCILSPFYLAAPMTFLALHYYNGEKGDDTKWVNYLAYPAILTLFALASAFMK